MARILIVDDEPQIRKFLRISLLANHHQVAEAGTAADALRSFEEFAPDLVIADLGLPDGDGRDLISTLRRHSSVPIIVLSVRTDEDDKVDALDRGANDYMVKPFGVGELMARIRAVLRPHLPNGEVLAFRDIEIDLGRRIVARSGVEIHLTRREWDLLVYLAQHADHVLTHKQILTRIWGPAHASDTAYLRVYITQLRQKLEADPTQPALIRTEAGIGYRLKSAD